MGSHESFCCVESPWKLLCHQGGMWLPQLLLYYFVDLIPAKSWSSNINFFHSICIQTSTSNSCWTADQGTCLKLSTPSERWNGHAGHYNQKSTYPDIPSLATIMNKPSEKSHEQKKHSWMLVAFHLFKLSYGFVPFFTYFCEYPTSVL